MCFLSTNMCLSFLSYCKYVVYFAGLVHDADRTCDWWGGYNGEMKRFSCLPLWNSWDMCDRSTPCHNFASVYCIHTNTHCSSSPLRVIYGQRFVFRVTINLPCEAFAYQSCTTQTLISPLVDRCNCVVRTISSLQQGQGCVCPVITACFVLASCCQS